MEACPAIAFRMSACLGTQHTRWSVQGRTGVAAATARPDNSPADPAGVAAVPEGAAAHEEGQAEEAAMKKSLMPRKHRIAYESIQRTKKAKRARVAELEGKRDALARPSRQ